MGDVRSRDVDGGWAWVALAAAIAIMTIMAGNDISYGIFQVELFKSFPGSQGFVSLIFSIALGAHYLLGPMSGLFSDLWTSRVPIMTGAAILSIGMMSASFAYDLPAMFFFYGIGCGTGSGLVFTACVTVVGAYFDKYRTLAFGFSLAAPGLGMIVTPYFQRWLIDEYGWRFAMASFACLYAQVIVLGALFYPHNPSLSPTCCCLKDHQQEKRRQPHMDMLESTKKNSLVDSCNEETQLLARPQTTRQRIQALLDQKFLWVFCLNQMLVTSGIAIGVNFFPAYAESLGVPSEDVPNLYTVYGLTLIVSRLVGGFVFNRFLNHLLTALFCAQFGMSLSQGLLPVYGVSYHTLFVERLWTSAMYGPSLLLVAPILVRYLGPQNLPVAFGIVMLCSGFGAVTAPAIAGTLYEVYGSFNVCYYLAGSTCALAVLSLLLIPLVSTPPLSQR